MPAPAHTSRRRVLLLAVGAVAGLGACSSRPTGPDGAPSATGATATPSSAPSAVAVPSTAVSGLAPGPGTVVATSVVDELQVHAAPLDPVGGEGGAGAVERVLDRREEISGQVVLLVVQEGPVWLQVQLPVRPNGSTGWVRARDVSLAGHRFAMSVELTAHRLSVTDAGSEVLSSPIGVGTGDTPTPGGDYYLKELLQPPDPTGVYGPYAYGLSGFSNVLTEFAGGEGVIGIHGTDRPDLVGQDVSSGCIRLPNDVITRLVEEVGLPLGTPVTISA